MSMGEWVVAVVLTLTLFGVLWYACETRKLAKEAREQRLLTTRPIVLLSPLTREHGRWNDDIAQEAIRLALPGPLAEATPVRIINMGPGIAVEIRVPYKREGRGPDEWVIDYLAAGLHDIEHNFYLAPKQGRSSQKVLKITYYDVFGNFYESTREFHKEPDSQDCLFTPLVHRELPRTRSRWKRRGMQSRKGNGPKGRVGA